jgi:hypothetical protein
MITCTAATAAARRTLTQYPALRWDGEGGHQVSSPGQPLAIMGRDDYLYFFGA